MVSDASLNRVYFGTDTRVQALLVGRGGGGAAGAGLVGAGPLRHADPVALGPLDRADTSGHRADDARRRWRTSRRAARRNSAVDC